MQSRQKVPFFEGGYVKKVVCMYMYLYVKINMYIYIYTLYMYFLIRIYVMFFKYAKETSGRRDMSWKTIIPLVVNERYSILPKKPNMCSQGE